MTPLEGSIAKWQAIVDGTGIDRGVLNCPLCQSHYRDDCWACPVNVEGKHQYCEGTLYDDWYEHQNCAHPSEDDNRVHLACPKCLRLAQAELEFLKGLRA